MKSSLEAARTTGVVRSKTQMIVARFQRNAFCCLPGLQVRMGSAASMIESMYESHSSSMRACVTWVDLFKA
ncbi:hypothetical protein ABIB34_002563 [Rhodococcus sp. UYP5]